MCVYLFPTHVCRLSRHHRFTADSYPTPDAASSTAANSIYLFRERGRKKNTPYLPTFNRSFFFIFTRFQNKDTRALPKSQKPGKKYFNGNVLLFFFRTRKCVFFFPGPFYIYMYTSFFFFIEFSSAKACAVIFSTKWFSQVFFFSYIRAIEMNRGVSQHFIDTRRETFILFFPINQNQPT